MAKMIYFVMSSCFLEDNLIMTNSCANATNSIAKMMNSIAKGTNSFAKVTNSITTVTYSITKTCNVLNARVIFQNLVTIDEVCKYIKQHIS